MKIFDTHTHDYFESFDENREEMLELCKRSGVLGKVQIGCDMKSSLEALDLSKKHKNMWSTLGIHPCDAEKTLKKYSEISEIFNTFQEIYDKNPENSQKIVGVGETGFDFFHKDTPELRKIQEDFFLEHLNFSQKNDLPLIIHNRNSSPEIIDFLKKNQKFLRKRNIQNPEISKFSGVFHCFSENTEIAKILTEELGFMLGIGGTSTYKKNTEIREAIKNTDIKFLVTETDSPFLAPQKHRGKQNNSTYITEIIELIAEIKNIPTEECAEILFHNAKKLFNL